MAQRFFPPFAIGSSVSNREIMDAFQCKNIGGIRYSTATRTIVLILNHNFPTYDNISDAAKGIYYFAGEGQEGDQTMDRGNRRLNNAKADGIEIHLFESMTDDAGYRYRGCVEVDGEPTQETQPDINGNARLVWVFKLKRGGQ